MVPSNKHQEEAGDDLVEVEEDHVDVRISSIGKKRNFSQSSVSVGSSNNSSNNSLQKPPVNRKSNCSLEVVTARKAEEEECYFSSSEEEEEEEEPVVESQQEVQPVREVRVVMEEERERPRVPSPPENLLKIKQKLISGTKLKPSDYVGFSKLPYQVYRRALR